MTTNTKSLLAKFSPRLAGLFLLIFIVISLWLIFEYAKKERNRDLMNWESRLALLAEIRSSAIEDWLGKRKTQLNVLANNASLKLFLSHYANQQQIDKSVLHAQQGHVRNLLRASAERFGFAENVASINQLNINQSSEYGLAILGQQQQLVMATKGFADTISTHQQIINQAYEKAQPQIIDLYAGKQQQPVYGFIIPVFKIQNAQTKIPVGAVMLLLDPQKTIYKILQNKQSVTRSDESLLVKQDGSSLVYISPLKDEFKLFHQLPVDNNQLAAAYAYQNPGGFAEMKDYQGDDVLVTGRKIKGSPWLLVQKISAAEALAESNKHQQFLLTTFTLLVLIIASAFIAIWRHSTSIRLQLLSDTLETRTALLDAVTDNIKEHIILLDKESRIIFINSAFAQALSLEAEEIKSNHLTSVLGKEAAELLVSSVSGDSGASILSLPVKGPERVYHVTASTLISGEHQNARLYVLHDISELKQEQEKREQLGRGIIGTLVKAVDLHDPFCINHSERTREVAREIGEEMGLSPEQQESLEMASLLANIGKLFVPKEILTKMQPLSDDESIELKKHIGYTVKILAGLSFNGPVVDIISQKNERLDGSGYPKGLSGEDIMLESRILAVANAFVAMASSRAYREGRKVREVVDILVKQSESLYDRQVVAALFHIAENKANWETWQSI